MIFSSSSPQSRAMFRQCWAAITVNIGMMSGGEYFGWPSPTLPKLSQPDAPFHVSHHDITMMVSLLYFGNFISPIPTSYMMDRFGRRKSLIVCSIFPILSWVLIAMAKSPMYLCVARLMAGIWLGIITTIAPMYTGEIASPKIRGALGSMFSLMTYIGVMFMYMVGPFVSVKSLAIIAAIVPVYFLLMLILMPESPYFDLMRKNRERAKESLRWLRGGVADDELEREVDEIENFVQQHMKNKGSWRAIFAISSNRRAFYMVQMYAIFVKFSGVGTFMAFLSITLPPSHLGILGPEECTMIVALMWVIFSIFSIMLIDKLGRKILLSVTSFGCAVFMFIAGVWFYLDTNSSIDMDKVSWIPFACFTAHAVLYALGLGPIATSIKGELLSADIRASASAITTLMFAATSLFLSEIYLPIADSIGMYVNYWFYAVSCFICTLYTIFMFVETKGKKLHEIQEQFQKKKKKTPKEVDE